jgi:ribonuclease HI
MGVTSKGKEIVMKEVTIYTDGACSGNPGPGGWAAILLYNGTEKELTGYASETTNNRMELQAAVEGLKALKVACNVKLYSDSAYLVNCFKQKWYKNWVLNGWRNSKNQPVENQDLWKEILSLMETHQVEYIKVKGHADNPYNNRCDELARAQIRLNG